MIRLKTRLRFEPLEDRTTPAAGGLDPAFGTDGIAHPTAPDPQYVMRVASVPDGRSLVLVRSGNMPFTYVVERFLSDGTPDATFGIGGVAPLTTHAASLTALPDGGAVLFGPETDNFGVATDFRVTRITSAGILDATFGTGGTTIISDFGTYGTFADPGNLLTPAPTILSDGSVIVVGNRTLLSTINGVQIATGEMAVARLTSTGVLDASFGTGGVTYVSFPVGQFNNAGATGAAVQADGRIVVGGYAAVGGNVVNTTNPPSLVNFSNPVAVRLLSDGQLDSTFGNGGRVLPAFSVSPSSGSAGQGGFKSVKVLDDGRIVLAGSMDMTGGPVGVAARLLPDGSVDATYGTNGTAVAGKFGFFPVAIDAAGEVVMNGIFTIVRLTQSGQLDARFGNGGQVDPRSLPGLSNAGVNDLAVQADGNILIAGAEGPNGYVARLLGNGPPAGFVAASAGTIVAGGPANGTIQVLASTGGTYSSAGTITAFPATTVRSTTADVNGDSIPDYIVGAGPGGLPQITVFDGQTGNVVADFLAFEASFSGGVFVAAGDLDGDSRAELVISPDQGGGPRVVVFSIAPGGAAIPRASFLGFEDPAFRGGARVALGDVNDDTVPDLAVAAGFLGGPRVALLDGSTILGPNRTQLVNDFFAFPGADAVSLRNGTYVAIGDIDGDGFADLIFGGGPGGAPRVFILDGQTVSGGNVAAAQAAPLANFFVNGDTAKRGGARVASVDADGDALADLVVGSGTGEAAGVRVYLGADFTSADEPGQSQSIAVFGGGVLADGVYVG